MSDCRRRTSSSGRAATKCFAVAIGMMVLLAVAAGCGGGDNQPIREPGTATQTAEREPGTATQTAEREAATSKQTVERVEQPQSWTSSALPSLDDFGLRRIECIGQSTCIAAGYRTQPGGGSTIAGVILTSHDSGVSWSIATLPPTSNRANVGRANVADIACADELRCVALLDFEGGPVLVTEDGGGTWQYRDTPPDSHLDAVSCSGSDCLAAGATDYPGPVETFVSDDAGVTWTRSGAPDVSGFGVFSVSCPTGNRCYLITSADDDVGFRLFVTDDRGDNWTDRTPAGQLLIDHVECTNDETCLVSGLPTLSRTADGGEYWNPALRISFNDAMSSISCGSGGLCVGVGDGRIASSLDGGQTWQMNEVPDGVTRMFEVSCDLPEGCVAVAQNEIVSTSASGQTDYRYDPVILKTMK